MKLFKFAASAAIMAWAAAGASAALAQTTLSMWYHGAGNEVELKLINELITDFNASQTDWKVELQSFPQAAYNDSVVAGALAGNLPDILDVDGPNMPNWAWAGYMQPLVIDETKIANFLPGTKGVWDGKLYSIGLWDAAVALVTRQSTLDELGLRKPTVDAPWTKDEFMAALDAAKAAGKWEFPLDLGMAWTGEWYPYAFSPFLQSFGGDIVDRTTYKTAEGALNGDAAMAFGEWWQGLFKNGYAQATQDPADRDGGFAAGKYAFSWNGNWAALGALAAFPDTVFLPAPDLGAGPKIGAASWQFGVSATSKNPQGAAAFIEFALQDKYLAAFSNGIGLIPATPTAAEMVDNYKAGGPLSVFVEYSAKTALVRPVTPGYVVQAKVFEKALADIANGADVAATLDAAADEINADIEKNGGYGH
ncbi:MAG: sugar-binding protein [Rhodobacteraceae bacterium PARR1]|nr:MAG: sugar-binding protein [Rhodobacteraceae bacterium PARR1]